MAAKPKKQRWLEGVRGWQPLIGTFVVIVLTVWVTSNLTAATKRTEFFLGFTKQYRDIAAEIYKYNKEIEAQRRAGQSSPSATRQDDANQIYFQLFSLIYDEVNAYENNFLNEEILVDWMTWQMHDYRDNTVSIGGVPYQEGWKNWLLTSGRYPRATVHVKKVYQCENRECVSRVVCEISWWQCHRGRFAM